jgi:predicted alpha/beta hydrolase family esterase
MGYHGRMTKQVLFIHGAGEGAYAADAQLAQNLQRELGTGYEVICPEMPDENNAPYELWKREIEKRIQRMSEPVILVGHSIGGSHLAKILTEIKPAKPIAGVFLLDAPYWGGAGWLYEGYEELKVPGNAAAAYPPNTKVFLFHTRDDEIVPFEHQALYAKLLPQAAVSEIDTGGHQLDGSLAPVAKDIRNLQ